MVELGYTQAVDVKLVADSQDNRKGHHGEDNNIYLNDANLNNTKDLLRSVKALASSGLLAILAVTASSVLWSLSTSFKKSLSSTLSVLTICWMAEVIMPDFLISLQQHLPKRCQP
jgi:hypothetical protein